MSRFPWALPLVCLLALSACSAKPPLVSSPAATPNPAPGPVGPPSYYLYVPPNVPADQPARLLIALHGIGGNGPDFGRSFVDLAREHGWILAAPTFAYGDWFSPANIRIEDIGLGRQILALMDDVGWRSGHEIRGRAYLAGFSRGAQLADRFALFHPERVSAVASLSAGTYTLPQASSDIDSDGIADELPLPFGTADMQDWVGYSLDSDSLRRVRFMVSVGTDDNNPGDLPRQWDPVIGRTRVARAVSFEHALEQLRVPAQLTFCPGAKHQLTPAMTAAVDDFLTRF